MSALRRHAGKLLLSLAFAVGIVWLLNRGGLPLMPGKESFSRVEPWAVAVYFAIYAIAHFVRATRWRWLLRPICEVPMRRILRVSFIGFAAIALLPARSGEAVRPLMIRRDNELSGWAATGTIAAERILDGLTMSLMLFAGLQLSTALSPLPDHIGDLPVPASVVPKAAYTALALFGSAFAVMGVFYTQRAWARRMTERIVGIVSPRLASWLADTVENVAAGLRFLPNTRFTVPFLLETATYWFLAAAGLWFLALHSGFRDFTLAEGCVGMGVVALGILVPSAPGYFGAYQLSFYAALAMFYPADLVTGPGAALVFLVYTSQLAVTILGAGIGALLSDRTENTGSAAGPLAGNLARPARPE